MRSNILQEKTGDAPVGELSEYADPEEPCL